MSTPIPSTAGVSRRRRPGRASALGGTPLLAIGIAVNLTLIPVPAWASTPVTDAATVSARSGAGTSIDPYLYEVTIDCNLLADGADETKILAVGELDKYYRIDVAPNCTTGAGNAGDIDALYERYDSFSESSGAVSATFQFSASVRDSFRGQAGAGYMIIGGPGEPPTKRVIFVVARALPSPTGSTGSTGTPAPAPDPTAATVAVVAEQVAAGGVAGSASGVRVRGSEVVPVTSRLSGAIGPRGGVSLSSDGLEVRVASGLGARADAGVLVPSNGALEASVTGALVPGSVIEVWINSQPRLVAAARVPEDGGTVTFAIPTGAPLDGGEPIEDGAHTLELRMYTTDGFEIVATGITVGQVTPTGVPAGEGGVPFGAAVLALFAAAGGAVLVGRRLVTAD